MKKKTKTWLWVRRAVILLIFVAFAAGMAHWYLEIRSINARVDAANARLAAYVEGRTAMEDAVLAGDYRGAVMDGLALRGSIALSGEEATNLLAIEGFAWFKLAETAEGSERWTDLRASRDAYEGALAGLNGVEDDRYASICASLGGVYFALAEYEDETASLATALAYYRLNAAWDGPQDPAVTGEVFSKIIYLQDQL